MEDVIASAISCIHLSDTLFDQVLLPASTEIGKLVVRRETVLDLTVTLTSFCLFFCSSFFIRDILIS